MEVGEDEAQQPPARARHINKRALKNKALAVSFNEKDLKDYVTGFHKRKKKRRKEAQKQQEEVLRRKRIEQRKQRKLERELVYGGAKEDSEKSDEDEKNDEESEPIASANDIKEYDAGDVRVTVMTSEISREDNVDPSEIPHKAVPKIAGDDKKKQSLGVSKKKAFKKVSKHKSQPKSRHSKGNKKKGKGKKNKKR